MDDQELRLLGDSRCYTLTMQIEHEIKILDIDPVATEQKLLSLGFIRKKTLYYRRFVYDTAPKKPSAWIRLRTDGAVATLTFKESLQDTIDGMKEIEIIVDDFDRTNELLTAAGHAPRNYQENKRIQFESKNCTASLDFWPQIPPYLEIESSDTGKVQQCLEDLAQLVRTTTTSLPTDAVYQKYGIDLSVIKELRF